MPKIIGTSGLSATERKVLQAAHERPIVVTVKEAGGVEYTCNGTICPAGAVAKLVERGLLIGQKDGLFDQFPQSFTPSEPKPSRLPSETASFDSEPQMENEPMKNTTRVTETASAPPPGAVGNGAAEPEAGNGTTPLTADAPVKASRFEAIENELNTGKRESIFRNLEALKIEPDEDEDDTSEEVLTSIAIRRPGKRGFRAHPDDKYQFEAFIIEDVKSKVSWYVVPSVGKSLAEQDIESLKHVILVLCIGKSGRMFFWPIPAKGAFRGSGLKAVEWAKTSWFKAVGDLEAGGYRTHRMLDEDYGEPAWPAVMPSVEELLELAFHDNIIDTLDHPMIKQAKNV